MKHNIAVSLLNIIRYINTNTYLLIVFIVLFLILLIRAQICNCDTSNKTYKLASIITLDKEKHCQEFQYNGLSLSHLFTWLLIGFIFYDKLWLSHVVGIGFEMLEYLIVVFDDDHLIQDNILKWVGGCFYYPKGKKNKHHPIDNITAPHSEKHWWHVKVSDVMLNLAGFYIGSIAFRLFRNAVVGEQK
jgi:hypothetical protein